MVRHWFSVLICLNAAAILLSGCGGSEKEGFPGSQPKGQNKSHALKTLRAKREIAKFRTRRIIMNNDGNDFRIQSEADLENPRAFLDKRTTPLLDSQVDSFFYCTGVFNRYSYPMGECELLPDRFIKSELVEPMKKKGIDSLKIMTEFCHGNGKEIFWSMRMNDTHDELVPENWTGNLRI